MQGLQTLGAAVASSEIGQHTLESGQSLGDSVAEEALRESPEGSVVPMLHVPEVKRCRVQYPVMWLSFL